MALAAIPSLPTPPSRSDDSETFVARADAFLAALAALVDDINDWSVAVPAEVSPVNFNATSVSSVAIGTGSKSFTATTGKIYFVGQWLIIASSASPTNYMVGQVSSYNSGTGALIVNVTYTSGSGTFASWSIGPAPVPNTTVNPRVVSAGTTTGTITPDAANAELYIMAGLTGPVTIAAPSGTPVQGQKLMLRLLDNGTTRALAWNAIYRTMGAIALPTATSPGKLMYVGLIYNSADTKWDVIALTVQP